MVGVFDSVPHTTLRSTKQHRSSIRPHFLRSLPQAKELQQSLAANITKLQFFMVRDLWDLPAGDALKLQEERRQRQPPPPPPTRTGQSFGC